jgi:hypothetical protein
LEWERWSSASISASVNAIGPGSTTGTSSSRSHRERPKNDGVGTILVDCLASLGGKLPEGFVGVLLDQRSSL